MIDNMKNILFLIMCKYVLPLILPSSFSTAENVEEEFTNIIHPKRKKNRPPEEISPPEVCVIPSMRFVI